MHYTFPAFVAALNRRGFKVTAGTLRNRLMEIAPEEATQSAAGRWSITVRDENHLLSLAERLAGPARKGG